MRNKRKVTVSRVDQILEIENKRTDEPSMQVVKCAFDGNRNCKATCSAFQALAEGDDVNLMCNRMSYSIGTLDTDK